MPLTCGPQGQICLPIALCVQMILPHLGLGFETQAAFIKLTMELNEVTTRQFILHAPMKQEFLIVEEYQTQLCEY